MPIKPFKASITLCPYPSKPTGNDIREMIFTTKEITNNELSELISKGHSFCHVFTNQNFMTQSKTIKNFKEANFIVFDFDDCNLSLDYVINNSIIKPSIAFETFSNSETNYRFKLIYVIDTPITNDQDYRRMTEIIFSISFNQNDSPELRKSLDTSCYLCNQMVHGTNPDRRIETNETVISIKLINQMFKNQSIEFNNYDDVFDFLKINIDFKPTKTNKIKSNIQKKSKTNCPRKRNSRQKSNTLHDLSCFPHFGTLSTNIFEGNFIYEDTFIKSKYNNYHTIQISEYEIDKVYYWVGNQNIYSLNTYFAGGKQKPGYRKKTLLYAAHVFCNLYPDITPQILHLKLKDYVLHFFECPLDIENDYIFRLANAVIGMDNHHELGKRYFVLNPAYKHLTKSQKMKALHQRKSELMRQYILLNHDGSLTLKQLAEKTHLHPRTVKKYLDADGICYSQNNRQEEAYNMFLEVYSIEENQTLSIRKMAEKCGISKSQVQRFLKRLL